MKTKTKSAISPGISVVRDTVPELIDQCVANLNSIPIRMAAESVRNGRIILTPDDMADILLTLMRTIQAIIAQNCRAKAALFAYPAPNENATPMPEAIA